MTLVHLYIFSLFFIYSFMFAMVVLLILFFLQSFRNQTVKRNPKVDLEYRNIEFNHAICHSCIFYH